MKLLIAVSTLLLGAVATTIPAGQDPTDDQGQGDAIVWETSFADAMARAQREGKGIFHLQLFGRLDDELC